MEYGSNAFSFVFSEGHVQLQCSSSLCCQEWAAVGVQVVTKMSVSFPAVPVYAPSSLAPGAVELAFPQGWGSMGRGWWGGSPELVCCPIRLLLRERARGLEW